MRVYISVDMEGIAGVVHADQVRRTGSDYAAARELMTLEANAAALGAFDGGAEGVLINDSHGDMRNLLLDRLDPRVQVISGNLKPFSMVQGVEDGHFNVALFVGYHAGAGTEKGILDHTYRSAVVSHIKVNKRSMNEAGLNALMAGSAGTPVGLVTGDETTCKQCVDLLGAVDTVTVKWAVGRYAARSLHPEEARKRIREAAARATRGAERFKPFVLPAPFSLELRMHNAGMADAAAMMPAVERIDGTTLQYTADTVQTLFRALQSLLRLGAEGLLK